MATRLARTHHALPPDLFALQRVGRGDILIEGQGMANEDCVGTLRIERTISFIGKLYGGKRRAAIQRQRPRQDHLPGEAETVVVGGAQRGHQALGAKADQGGLSMEGASVARSEEHTSELQSLMRISY